MSIKPKFFPLTTRSELPVPHYISVYPTPDIFMTVFQFFKIFFKCQDTDIAQLANCYGPTSIFDIVFGEGVRIKGMNSRNIKNITAKESIVSYCSVGTERIIESLRKLGGTTHSMTKMSIDVVHIQQLGIIVCPMCTTSLTPRM